MSKDPLPALRKMNPIQHQQAWCRVDHPIIETPQILALTPATPEYCSSTVRHRAIGNLSSLIPELLGFLTPFSLRWICSWWHVSMNMFSSGSKQREKPTTQTNYYFQNLPTTSEGQISSTNPFCFGLGVFCNICWLVFLPCSATKSNFKILGFARFF